MNDIQLWHGSSVDWSILPKHQGCWAYPQAGHIWESANECINKWYNKLMFLSLINKTLKMIRGKISKREVWILCRHLPLSLSPFSPLFWLEQNKDLVERQEFHGGKNPIWRTERYTDQKGGVQLWKEGEPLRQRARSQQALHGGALWCHIYPRMSVGVLWLNHAVWDPSFYIQESSHPL